LEQLVANAKAAVDAVDRVGYFDVLKGLGGTARLVVMPHESHGYAARESIMHMLWETGQWLEKWVKQKP